MGLPKLQFFANAVDSSISAPSHTARAEIIRRRSEPRWVKDIRALGADEM